MSNILRFISMVAYEFYANLHENVSVPREKEFDKVYVRGHVYDFSQPFALI